MQRVARSSLALSRAAVAAGARRCSTAAAKPKGGIFANLKKHPDYEGLEAVVRYYLPHNSQISMAMLGLYTVLIAVAIMRSNSKAAWEAANAPAPTKPDFHTQKVISGVPSLSEQPDAWEEFVTADEENMEKWLATLDEEEAD